MLCNFIEIPLRHGCSPVNLLHIFRIPFHKNTYGRLLLIHGLEEVTKIYENMQNVQYFSKFAGFGLQLYYQRAPSQLFRKEKGFRYNFFRICRATTFQNYFISHISSWTEDSCSATNCLFKINNTKNRQAVKCV